MDGRCRQLQRARQRGRLRSGDRPRHIIWVIWLKPKFGRLAPAAAGIFSLTALYPLSVIMIRGSLGEILAYFLLVLNFYLLDRLIKRPNRWRYLLAVGGLTAFLLSHNITVVF